MGIPWLMTIQPMGTPELSQKFPKEQLRALRVEGSGPIFTDIYRVLAPPPQNDHLEFHKNNLGLPWGAQCAHLRMTASFWGQASLCLLNPLEGLLAVFALGYVGLEWVESDWWPKLVEKLTWATKMYGHGMPWCINFLNGPFNMTLNKAQADELWSINLKIEIRNGIHINLPLVPENKKAFQHFIH